MLYIGEYQELNVNREVDFGVYLGDGTEEVLLPTKYIPEGLQVNDTIRVFVYKDSEDRPIATTLQPTGKLGDIVALKVKDQTEHGAYLDWGLEKDLFVPRREQPVHFETGKTYVVRISMDHKTNRLVGTGKLNAFLSKETGELEEGQEVDLMVYGKTELGFKAVVNGKYSGLIYASEAPPNVKVGDRMPGYIRTLRQDGKIDLRISAEGRAGTDIGRDTLLRHLNEAGGSLSITDKSSPDEIYKTLGMSKKLFKKALGGLYKDRLVTISEDGITLKAPQGS